MSLTSSSCRSRFVVAGRLVPDGSCASLATTLSHHRAICEVPLNFGTSPRRRGETLPCSLGNED